MFVAVSGYSRKLNIYYVSHSVATNERALIHNLQLVEPDGDSESAIFYLTNSSRPVIAFYNFPVEGSSLSAILDEIDEKSSHEVYPDVDMEKLLEIFTLVENDRNKYDTVTLNYYIDSIFWEFYKESIIARLYHALELHDRPDFLDMNIYFTQGDTPQFDEKYPFGKKYQCTGYRFTPLTLFEN